MPRSHAAAGSASRSGAGTARRSALRRESDWWRQRAQEDAPKRLAEIQRSRLFAGAIGAIEEFGYGQATVAQITARARVSRRTFYELFENREQCVVALVEEVVGRIESEVAAANLGDLPWRERVRRGLCTILSFFDREPALARVCVVQASHGGPAVLTRREEVLARMAAVIDEGRGESSRAADCATLTAEGLIGAACAIVHARLLRDDHEPLIGLLGELMSMIVLPYLGAAAARREQALPSLPVDSSESRASTRPQSDRDPLQDIPMRLTYRTALVLERIAQQSQISNREVAEQAGVSDQGQISKLLARLRRLGLIENTGVGHVKGEPNAWRLTPLGRQVTRRLSVNTSYEREVV
jgi:AcrR family transcriptional regulator/DNA-binding MarR family transcriptional regulator